MLWSLSMSYFARKSGKNFFFKVFHGHMSFLGETGTPVLDFWLCLLWVSKPYSHFCRGKCNVHSLRSTSGATHANLLAASITASHFHTCISRGGTWLGFE